jgi:hypothetical protein
MENSSLWPTNKYGTPWRQAAFLFDWRDEALVEEAIETVDPLKITVRYRFVAVVGFESDADMVMHRLADTLPPKRRYDNDHMCAVLDSCTDPESLWALVEYEIPTGRFSIFGVGVLDLADGEMYGSLMAALADRRERFVGEMPVIEFRDTPLASATGGQQFAE